jgi:hypothetical protein
LAETRLAADAVPAPIIKAPAAIISAAVDLLIAFPPRASFGFHMVPM